MAKRLKMRGFFKNILVNCVTTVGTKSEVDEITRAALILQRIFGQQVLDPNWTWKRFSLHYIFFLCIFIYVFFGTLETFQNTNDAELVAEANYTLILTLVFPIKLLIFIKNRFVFQDLYLMTKKYLIPAIKESGKLDSVSQGAKKIVYLLLVSVIVPILNYEIIALINYINRIYTPLSKTTSSLMPKRSPYHEIAWILHSIFMCLVTTTIILDMWFVLLVYFLCLASDNLVTSLKLSEKSQIDTVYMKELNSCLKIFYRGHIVFIRFLRAMNKIYKWLALVPLCNAAMGICMILLVMTKGSYAKPNKCVNFPEINYLTYYSALFMILIYQNANLLFAVHIVPMFGEIFIYNWFGEKIKSQARAINIALFNFDWMSLSANDKKNYYIIVTFVNNAEFGIKTAVGNDLCLVTMTSVLQITYKAFTVLQSVA